MYQAPDFVKVDVKVRNSLAASSKCDYDEGTNYTQGGQSICTDGGESDHPYASYIDVIPDNTYLCYSTYDE